MREKLRGSRPEEGCAEQLRKNHACSSYGFFLSMFFLSVLKPICIRFVSYQRRKLCNHVFGQKNNIREDCYLNMLFMHCDVFTLIQKF